MPNVHVALVTLLALSTIPEDYNRQHIEFNYSYSKPPPVADTLVITSIPPRPALGPDDDPNGHSEWLVHGVTTKAKVPIPKTAFRTPSYSIQSASDMGDRGLFATRDIPACQNVNLEFSKSSFSFQFTVEVDIKAGEELFYMYCSNDFSHSERQSELTSYGFTCHCPACEYATPETDILRKQYKGLAQTYLLTLNWVAKGDPKPKESTIEPVMRLYKGMRKEGLTYVPQYRGVVMMLGKFYEGIGKEDKAKPLKEEYERLKKADERMAKWKAKGGSCIVGKSG
ncbi:hypothetical protein CPB84DRAFT_1787553 [Gymnopilus junonius]|uniref:SET domain-containing protein n=1 Tax=Gymnopilus junonius TaxID=109634 RepID=A0A9P5TIY5_GYMJU|nr:hypothetical protein CPB84DRAFT_1787553 [Gymnopilus junonius]